MVKATEKVRVASDSAKPYVDRALHDEELRESVKRAYGAAYDVYNELVGRRGVTGVASRIAGDAEIQANLRTAASELRNAAARLQAKDRHTGRNVAFLLIGILIGILFNPVTGPDTRRWVKDRVSGNSSNGQLAFDDASENSGAIVPE
jgi:hypothetical protein